MGASRVVCLMPEVHVPVQARVRWGTANGLPGFLSKS